MPSATLRELPPPPAGKTGWPWTEAASPTPPTRPNSEPWPRATIVTPSYNQADYLEETIRSVLLQGYPNLEYIIVDGGSTDGSVEIIQRYAAWLDWWVSEPDEGQSHAINKGFERASGALIAWLNSDDVYLPGAITESAAYLAAHPEIALVYGDLVLIDTAGKVVGRTRGESTNLKKLLTKLASLPQPTVFIRSNIASRCGLLRTDLHYLMDLEWWIRMATNNAVLAYIPGDRALFRLHLQSKTVDQRIGFAQNGEQIVTEFFANPNLAAFYQHWRRRAFSTAAANYGRALLEAGRRREALVKLRRALYFALPGLPRTLYLLLMITDALTGLHTYHLPLRIRRRLAGKSNLKDNSIM